MARFYAIHLAPNLFGGWDLTHLSRLFFHGVDNLRE
jgi:hypothetical protein